MCNSIIMVDVLHVVENSSLHSRSNAVWVPCVGRRLIVGILDTSNDKNLEKRRCMMSISDEVLRKMEIRQIRKMVREVRKNGDSGVSHFLEHATKTNDDTLFSLLEDVLDIEWEEGRLYFLS
jgi:hypothetical protein